MKTLSLGNFEVVVVGSGITGLSVVRHLLKRGVEHVGLISSSHHLDLTSKGAGFFCAGFWDNYSRLTQNHGPDFAKTLMEIMRSSFNELSDEMLRCGVPLTIGHRIRLITSDHEKNEAEKAVDQLNKAGFQTTFQKSFTNDQSGREILALQDEGMIGAVCDISRFMQASENQLKVKKIKGDVTGVEKKDGTMVITLHDGRQVKSIMVVLACHAAIPSLIPALKEILIPYVDQWSMYSIKSTNIPAYFTPGNVVSANHGNEWGCIDTLGRIRWGGGRYLRPLAGIGTFQGEMSQKISEHLKHRLQGYIKDGVVEKIEGGESFSDFWPCDELPVIGPMFGQEQILIASGFMGHGLVWAEYSGKVLAEVITNGRSNELPSRLTPTRFRTLD